MAIAAPTIAVDHVTASVIQGALENIAVEMGYKLMRMSYSSIIRESEDFGAPLVDAQGRGLAESAQSTPLQSGRIPGYVRGVLAQTAERGEPIRPGDVIMHNDAYAGASHGPDVAFIVPIFVGDMEAQVAAARIGAERFVGLCERYGSATVEAACDAVMKQSERLMRAAIAKVPDGVYRAETRVDGFLASGDPRRRDLPIVVTLTVAGDEITVDLTGSADQVSDRPINMPFVGSVDIAIWLTIRSILLDTAVHGHIPVNDGLARPIRIVAPKGSIANPIFPAPTIARFCAGNQVANAVMKALGQAVPSQIAAGIGNLKVLAFSGIKDETHWVHMEIIEGSYGGRDGLDGMDAVDTLYANTRNNPIEDIESHLPLRVRRYELREDVSGAGKWRGGFGSIREFEYLSDGGGSVEGDGHGHRPWGFDGGAPGQVAALILERADGTTERLPSNVPH